MLEMFLNIALSCLQVLGSSVRLPLRPSDSLTPPLHLLLLPGLWEGFLLQRTGTEVIYAPADTTYLNNHIIIIDQCRLISFYISI